MSKTIRYAVKRQFNEECQEALIDAFSAAHCLDLYDGDLKSYIEMIASRLRTSAARIEKLEATLETIENIAAGQ